MFQMMKFLYVGLIFICSSIKSLENPFGEVTSYFTVSKVTEELPVVGECSPSLIWILAKHGARDPDPSLVAKMRKIIPKLRDDLVKAWIDGRGHMLEKDISEMKHWNAEAIMF